MTSYFEGGRKVPRTLVGNEKSFPPQCNPKNNFQGAHSGESTILKTWAMITFSINLSLGNAVLFIRD